MCSKDVEKSIPCVQLQRALFHTAVHGLETNQCLTGRVKLLLGFARCSSDDGCGDEESWLHFAFSAVLSVRFVQTYSVLNVLDDQ